MLPRPALRWVLDQGLGIVALCAPFRHGGVIPSVASTRAAGGGDVACASDFEDCDGEVPQGCHDLGSVAGADLGGVFAVGTSRMWCSASICQWPRIHPASWAGVAWLAVRLVIA